MRAVILGWTALAIGCHRDACEGPRHPFAVEGVLTGAQIDQALRRDVAGLGPCIGACFTAAREEQHGQPVEIDVCQLAFDPSYVPPVGTHSGYYSGSYGYYDYSWTFDSGWDTGAERPGGTVSCAGRAVRYTCWEHRGGGTWEGEG